MTNDEKNHLSSYVRVHAAAEYTRIGQTTHKDGGHRGGDEAMHKHRAHAVAGEDPEEREERRGLDAMVGSYFDILRKDAW